MEPVGIEVLTTPIMNNFICRGTTTCNPSKVDIRFGGTCLFHLLSRWFLLGLFIDPEDVSEIFLRDVV
jgi:hypothetical protein